MSVDAKFRIVFVRKHIRETTNSYLMKANYEWAKNCLVCKGLDKSFGYWVKVVWLKYYGIVNRVLSGQEQYYPQ